MMNAEAAPPSFYLIPGLGADERVFQFLHLRGQVHVLQWLPPQSPDEELPRYAVRLAEAVPPTQVCWLVGVSFGGLLAQEIGKLRPLARVVLISSFAGPEELPWLARLGGATGLYRILPVQLFRLLPQAGRWLFSVSSGRDYQLLRQIIRDTDPRFARWAIGQLLQWPGSQLPVIRIHGTQDRLLAAGAALSQYQLAGGHFIIVSRAVEISQILNQLAAEAKAVPQAVENTGQ